MAAEKHLDGSSDAMGNLTDVGPVCRLSRFRPDGRGGNGADTAPTLFRLAAIKFQPITQCLV